MIQRLASNHTKSIAYSLLIVFYCSVISPLYAGAKTNLGFKTFFISDDKTKHPVTGEPRPYLTGFGAKPDDFSKYNFQQRSGNKVDDSKAIGESGFDFIGGPSQPEMSSFKSAGTSDMVNLFTGDFSYNIPLLDVDGYPVNIFYNSGIGMEQEASWVGLGWNINPGTITRNMRGVPDDFDGSEQMIQEQAIKENTTWGGKIGSDVEIVGIKNLLGLTVGNEFGVSINSYLGPEVELGLSAGVSFKLANLAGSEKTVNNGNLQARLGASASLSSRNGLTINPNISLTSRISTAVGTYGAGIGASTSYNSRTGIKSLQLYEQTSMSYNTRKEKTAIGSDGKPYSFIATKGSGGFSNALRGTSISFNKPSYTPAIRMPITNGALATQFEMGLGMFGITGSGKIEVYKQKSEIALSDRVQRKPMVGYMYAHKAMENRDAVMDFTRFNDKEVTPKTPIISVPQYTYDVFTISGEGTGGTIRAYRNDQGYVRDNRTQSRDNSFSLGVDIAVPGHIGANFNMVKTPSVSGDWEEGNLLRMANTFKSKHKLLNESVYFKNPGEISVVDASQFDKIGGLDLVRYKLSGDEANPVVLPVLEKFSEGGAVNGVVHMPGVSESPERKKRTQVINILTAEKATEIGLESGIKNYSPTSTDANLDGDTLTYALKNRVDAVIGKKPNHISEVNVLETDGKRYVYGLPVYNLVQKDFTFSVDAQADANDLVDVTLGESLYTRTFPANRDGYILNSITPAYAHSFLLTGLMSADYVDVTGNGISEDDLGTAVKYNYTQRATPYKWRTPSTVSGVKGHYNGGNLTEAKDDKALLSYGEREAWYLHSIESKTMIAFFTTENRRDAKGVFSEFGTTNTGDNTNQRLKKIDLYNKADIRKNGLASAKPIKTVWFEYDYSLCANAPGNDGMTEGTLNTNKGKLTLKSIFFTYNGQTRANKNRYVFQYDHSPAYEVNASDRWGNYKPKNQNPQGLKNSVHPYGTQNATLANTNAAAWNLSKILLPSGGQLEVDYESDDYAFVQDRRATVMMPITSFGRESIKTANRLYDIPSRFVVKDNDKVYLTVPVACANADEVYQRYLTGIEQLAFKLAVKMPKGLEYITVYAYIESFGVGENNNTIWIQLKKVDGFSPLSLTAIEHLREHLPGQAYKSYESSPEDSKFAQLLSTINGMLQEMDGAFENPVKFLRGEGKAQEVDLAKSFVRLNVPAGVKYGGGHRVKAIRVKDNWNAMTSQYNSTYGQKYDYTTTEIHNGVARTISSGVASYEPSIGGEENPFQEMLQIANRIPLGPSSYESIEMPVLDAFIPSPLVGYSKVTVKSLKSGELSPRNGQMPRSVAGRQVTEFYTAKEFPVKYEYTNIDPASDFQKHESSKFAFFQKWAFDSRAISQGFKIEINDMHGKMKSQSTYGEDDANTRISYIENYYRNTGKKGFDEKFDFVYKDLGGEIKPGNMGVEVELMSDTREFSVNSNSLNVQAQVDWMLPAPFPIWLPFIWPVVAKSENYYRAVTVTKVINYHGILDSTIVIDKGSAIGSRNMIYDAETGSVVVARTNNAFEKPVYQTNYPAWWAYGGMGLAYKNINGLFEGVNFMDGKVTSGIPLNDLKKYFESGDELYIIQGEEATACIGVKLSGPEIKKIWAVDKMKNSSSLINPEPDFIFIDEKGYPYSRANVTMQIVRSGRRNMLASPLASFVSLSNPDSIIQGKHKLTFESTTNKNVLNSSAIMYKEKWLIDMEQIARVILVNNITTCTYDTIVSCSGIPEPNVNPYRKGLLGNFRVSKNMIFYGERAQDQTSLGTLTNLSKDGTLKDFVSFWDFNISNNLIPTTSTKWVWNSEITKVNSRGMEIETRDALNVYTAAQYGYAKNLPLAITNNSRFHQSFAEGFEDKLYKESLNNVLSDSCVKQNEHVFFDRAKIVNARSNGIKAHSGYSVLKLSPGSSYTTSVPVNDVSENLDYGLVYQTQTNQSEPQLVTPGVNCTVNYNIPISEYPVTTVSPTTFKSAHGIRPSTTNSTVTMFGFIELEGNPVLDAIVRVNQVNECTQGVRINSFSFIIRNPQNNITYWWGNGSPVQYNGNSCNVFSSTGSFFQNLCKKVYRIELTVNFNKLGACAVPPGPSSYPLGSIEFEVKKSVPNPCYSSLPAMISHKGYVSYPCTFTKPVPGNEAMMNGVFQVPADRKMIFSGWTREQCTDPCAKTTYADSRMQLVFKNSANVQVGSIVPLVASGSIVDGWQKMEASFTAPSGAVTMDIVFINDGVLQPSYFDDIRIHPYNANMNSYVYDPVNLRLLAQLDANNYATYFEYDEEGGLIRKKVETVQGIKTIEESRSAKQKNITTIQN